MRKSLLAFALATGLVVTTAASLTAQAAGQGGATSAQSDGAIVVAVWLVSLAAFLAASLSVMWGLNKAGDAPALAHSESDAQRDFPTSRAA